MHLQNVSDQHIDAPDDFPFGALPVLIMLPGLFCEGDHIPRSVVAPARVADLQGELVLGVRSLKLAFCGGVIPLNTEPIAKLLILVIPECLYREYGFSSS